MHNAPSVTYPVGRSRNAIRLVLGIWILGACGVFAWCLGQARGLDAAWKPALLLFAVALAAWGGWRSVRQAQEAVLDWNGEHWSVAGTPSLSTGRATVHLDIQFLVLVRVVEAGRPAKWLWLDRAAMPERWLDLRRALHAHVATPETSQSSNAAERAGRMDSA